MLEILSKRDKQRLLYHARALRELGPGWQLNEARSEATDTDTGAGPLRWYEVTLRFQWGDDDCEDELKVTIAPTEHEEWCAHHKCHYTGCNHGIVTQTRRVARDQIEAVSNICPLCDGAGVMSWWLE